MMDKKKIAELLGNDAALLEHKSTTVTKEQLHLPGPDYVDRCFVPSDRKPAVLGNLQRMFNTGRLAGTGYLSILPVDQGIERSGGASFGPPVRPAVPHPITHSPGRRKPGAA